MARLLRKKTASPKSKKKKNSAEASAIPASNAGAAKPAATLVSVGRDAPKRQALSQKKALVKARQEPGKIKSYFDKSIQFLREVKVELKKVTWPTRKQTMSSTLVVIILVMIISIFLGVVDMGLSSLIRVVFQ
ncbi:MAG: preprotein translocase subunit SecE [Proteobacteria bacterium]|nr:preprotein translocase subunit SecE [Pseudomonadota bacterium]